MGMGTMHRFCPLALAIGLSLDNTALVKSEPRRCGDKVEGSAMAH
jgi:hypothetical protein